MKSMLRTCNDGKKIYQTLMFVCPGCVAGGPDGYDGLHNLPVNIIEDINKPSWNFDGNLESPTLSPSILTHGGGAYSTCHSFLKAGVFDFLIDSTHPLAGQKVPIPDLPAWAVALSEEVDDG